MIDAFTMGGELVANCKFLLIVDTIFRDTTGIAAGVGPCGRRGPRREGGSARAPTAHLGRAEEVGASAGGFGDGEAGRGVAAGEGGRQPAADAAVVEGLHLRGAVSRLAPGAWVVRWTIDGWDRASSRSRQLAL